MKYNFKCSKCGNTKIVKIPMKDIQKVEIFCENCGEKMNQDWTSNLHVPEHMRADETQEMEWVKERLKNRPSGRRKVYY